MVTCYHCGQSNAEGTLICRYCGGALASFGSQARATQPKDYEPPQPHLWASETPPAPVAQAQPYASQFPAHAGYRCPHCGSAFVPMIAKKISADGWLTFALLLFFCPPFFWIGLLMKEEYRMCATCGTKFG
jgi:hypothetical protein